MLNRARMSMSADGYVTTPSDWPALVGDPAFVPGARGGLVSALATPVTDPWQRR
jgi:hypothetical protein